MAANNVTGVDRNNSIPTCEAKQCYQADMSAPMANNLVMEAQRLNLRSQAFSNDEWNKANTHIWEASEKAKIDIAKTAEVDYLHFSSNVKYAKLRADIHSCHELQSTLVQISADGTVSIIRELFGEEKQCVFDYRIGTNSYLLHCDENGEDVLYVTFLGKSGKRDKRLILPLSNLSLRRLEMRFITLGIGFNYNRKKNEELLLKLIDSLVNVLPRAKLSLRHGWKKNGEGQMEFIFPNILTWEDIKSEK